MGRLDGKVAVIGGAGTGVGRACMVRFAEEGAKVVGAARTQSDLDETLAFVDAAGGEGAVLVADLSTEEGAADLVDVAVDRFGGIDVLVNSAGVGWSYGEEKPGSMDPIESTSLEDWNRVLGINLGSVFLTSRAAIPRMRARGGGSIINVSSVAGTRSLVDAHTYVAGKGAVNSLTRGMAQTYAADGIRTNTVAPGFIDTPMVASVIGAFDDPVVAGLLCPMGRPARADEIAACCLFFASDDSSYCNGACLEVDGGTTARMFALPPDPVA